MAKEIIIAGVQQNPQSQALQITGWYWFPITSGAKTQANGSAWSGASAAENSAIEAGTVLEVSFIVNYPIGTPVATLKSLLQQDWANKNSALAGLGPAVDANVYYDGSTGWSA